MTIEKQKIVPFFWFGQEAEEAANYYVSIFKDARITAVTRYGKEGPGPDDAAMVVNFELFGQSFVALNGNPDPTFKDSMSFYVKSETQEEIDLYWDAILASGGQTLACGWIRDKFGVAWQITPPQLPQMLQDPDPEKAGRVMKKMMTMIKIELQPLIDAYNGN